MTTDRDPLGIEDDEVAPDGIRWAAEYLRSDRSWLLLGSIRDALSDNEERAKSAKRPNRRADPHPDYKNRPWNDWLNRAKAGTLASTEAAVEHVKRGGLVGLVPGVDGLAVLDVDTGDPSDLERRYPPLATAATRRGAHLFYAAPDKPLGNSKWETEGCSGEVRCSNGYVVVWDPMALWDALRVVAEGRAKKHPFPMQVLAEHRSAAQTALDDGRARLSGRARASQSNTSNQEVRRATHDMERTRAPWSQEEFAAAYGDGLRRVGRELHGPCPLCKGVDRFRVMPNGKFYCRRCLPDGKDKDRFKELLRVIGLANDTTSDLGHPRTSAMVDRRLGRPPLCAGHSGEDKNARDGAGLARELVRSLPGLSDGARRWLAFRGLDADRLEAKDWRSLTPRDYAKLESLPLEYGFTWNTPGKPRWPPGTGRHGEVLIIPCRGMDGKIAGARFRTSKSWRRRETESGRKGPKVVGLPGCPAVVYGADSFRPGCRVVHVCEGETDSESLIEAGAAAPVVGLPGATVWRPLVPLLTRHRVSIQRVVIWFDGDEAGQAAAARLAKRLDTAVWTAQLPAGKDVNDWLRDDSEGFASAVTEAETRSRRVTKALRV